MKHKKTVWSLGVDLDVPFMKEEVRKLETLRKDLQQIRKQFLFSYLFIFSLLVVSIFFFRRSDNITSFFPLLFGFIYYVYLKKKYKAVTKDLLKLEVAKRNGWIYDPKPSYVLWKMLYKKYPYVFLKGSSGQKVEDQFFGEVKIDKKLYSFHSGIFTYTVSRGKHSQTYHRRFFGLKLKNNLKKSFLLYPDRYKSKLHDALFKKDITIESNNFNDLFAFKYSGKKSDVSREIFKFFTPSVQEMFISFYNKYGSFDLFFGRDCLIVDFGGMIAPDFISDITKSSKLSETDLESINKKIYILLEIATSVARKLD